MIMSKMIVKIMKSVVGFLMLATGAFAFQIKQNPQLVNSQQPPDSTPPTNLVLILEGPIAVCTAPDNHPGKILILIPNAKDHFNPGFDAGGNETPLCSEDYHMELGQHKPGNPMLDATFDTVPIQCPTASSRYLSLLVDTPDQITAYTTAAATITGDYARPGQRKYVTRTELYYAAVDLTNTFVDQVTPSACSVSVPDGTNTQQVPVTFPYSPQFSVSGADKLLVFGMTPSIGDDASHHHEKDAYKAETDMVGVNRAIDFPTQAGSKSAPVKSPKVQRIIGPHNDCRAPQIFVQPGTAKASK
jgi:hypothetical protein